MHIFQVHNYTFDQPPHQSQSQTSGNLSKFCTRSVNFRQVATFATGQSIVIDSDSIGLAESLLKFCVMRTPPTTTTMLAPPTRIKSFLFLGNAVKEEEGATSISTSLFSELGLVNSMQVPNSPVLMHF
mmetsp:Transcript_11136/g.16286  ORF Transcript_11136/g.16286 Transcript_11136/m.16286 type:complete len:128 (-) Transcript_11136:3380-3763(-)